MIKAKKDPPKLNSEWHKSHPMPKNPTIDQRIQWHTEHRKYCLCRDLPESLKEEMRKRKIPVPE